MPPTGYLNAFGIEAGLLYLASKYPSICQLIVLPEQSHEGRTIRAVKIAGGTAADRPGVLFIGGVHAREIVNPDLLLSFAQNLCQAYTPSSSGPVYFPGTGLVFGGKSYSASTVQVVVNSLDIFIFPLVNPDGRVYVQSPKGDPWWRKNRNPNPGLNCMGVDLNRNYDFLWSSGIGTSPNPCNYDFFKGSAAFSEPETRNVRHLLDTYPNIMCMADVHSYAGADGELVLHPWGDDKNQTFDPSQNFMNSKYEGLRGTPWDTLYKEYIPAGDLDWFVTTGNSVRDAIAAVRGRVYTVQQAGLLYPVSGTGNDYPYSRHFVDATKKRVFSYTLETGTEFQPLYGEALDIISEVSAGLIEFCLACFCVIEETVRGTALEAELSAMRGFRDVEMVSTSAGRKYLRLLQENAAEILQLVVPDERLRRQAVDVLSKMHGVVLSRNDPKPKAFDAKLIRAADDLLTKVSDKGSTRLKKAIAEVRQDLRHFRGAAVLEGLKSASRPARPRRQRGK